MSDLSTSVVGKTNLEDRICALLKAKNDDGARYSALEIAKAVGLHTAKDVNSALYSLMKSGRLYKTEDLPPLWYLEKPKGATPESRVTTIQPSIREQDLQNVLKRTEVGGKGLKAHKIAKELGQSRQTVNKHLHNLRSRGKVEQCTRKSLWTWKDEGTEERFDTEESESQDYAKSLTSRGLDQIEHLGHGGYGCVFKAKHKVDGKFYAVKIVEFTGEADREVKALACFDHPNIVRYFTCWSDDVPWNDRTDVHSSGWTSEASESSDYTSSKSEEDQSGSAETVSQDSSTQSESSVINSNSKAHGCLFIQMEFCEKGTLLTWIDERNTGETQRTREDALEIFHQIVRGVKYIHSKNLIHRDLKPENILFGNDGTIKIGDFGLVTTVTNQNGGPVERTKKKGTESYMSPEQMDKRTYDEKTDIFPLGLICFELLWKMSTGTERAKVWPDLRNQVFPKEFCEEYMPEHKLIRKMLYKAPARRLDAKEIAEFLNNFLVRNNSPSPQRTV